MVAQRDTVANPESNVTNNTENNASSSELASTNTTNDASCVSGQETTPSDTNNASKNAAIANLLNDD